VLDQGRVPWPSRIRADVPAELDAVVARSLLTTTPPKGRAPYQRVGELVEALSGALAPPVPRGHDRARTAWRALTVGVAAIAVLALLWSGIALVRGAASPPLVSPRTPTASASVPVASPPPTTSSAPVERVIAVVSASDYDPFGDTREENPELAPLAIDGDPASAWKTVRYRREGLSGKEGVGLLLDLGAPRPVSAVQLRLVGAGTDVSLRAGESPDAAPDEFTVMAEAVRAGDEVTLRVPRPVTARYLLVWLTELPSADGGYQGGVSDVVVRG
jgi:putative peptidoglycan lipid II flippase